VTVNMTHSFLLSLLLLVHTHAQLIGNRGVFTLPEGVEYRDSITREASRLAGKFAEMFQMQEKAHVKIQKKMSVASSRAHTPFFGPQVMVTGRALTPGEVLDFQDSRVFNPPRDQRRNRLLEEVEMERTTSRERPLPNTLDKVRTKPSDSDDSGGAAKPFVAFQAVPTPRGAVRVMKKGRRGKIAVRRQRKRLRMNPRPPQPAQIPRQPPPILAPGQPAPILLPRQPPPNLTPKHPTPIFPPKHAPSVLAPAPQQFSVFNSVREIPLGLQPHSSPASNPANFHLFPSPAPASINSVLPGTLVNPGLIFASPPSSSPHQVVLNTGDRDGFRIGHHKARLGTVQGPSLAPSPTAGPPVFDRTPSSLTDVNSDLVSSNVFGRDHIGSFMVKGPNYSISWG